MNFIDYSNWFDIDGFHALFSKKQVDFSDIEKRKKFVESLSLDHNRLVMLKQVHSNQVQMVKNPGILDSTDGVISNRKDIVLSVQVADCIPLFLVDRETGYFGLIHSGWRGTAAEIGIKAIYQFQKTGSYTENILALMGPSINQCCYEIGPQVSNRFDSSFFINGTGDRKMFDLKGALKYQLTQSGLEAGNIMSDDACTYCQEELYFSFRRDGVKSGRMVAIIGWS